MELEDFEDDVIEEILNLSDKVEEEYVIEKKSGEKVPKPEHLNILSKYFGHQTFRPLQWNIISAIIEDRRDVCAIMSTGYGKSLCFQYPSTFLGGITLVVSPLISLMEDQILSLKVANISACLLGSAQSEKSKVITEIFDKVYNMIYLTPEFCGGDYGRGILQRMATELDVNLLAVDEAHCISSWGHEFRQQYKNLGHLRWVFPTVPIIAVTATATPQIRDDIIKSLNLKNPLIVSSGFDRPNLYFEVNSKNPNGILATLKSSMYYVNANWKFSGPTIIYCITRKQTEEVAETLRHSGITCLPYHAGLSLKMRKETHQMFVRDKVEVVVATIAFGMGIDKPDIRNVIHYGTSKSIENYYQEVGRAGRDGQPANCITFYSNSDFTILRNLETKCKKKTTAKLDEMEAYLTTRQCRRKYIINHFDSKEQLSGDVMQHSKTNCCDNCKRLGRHKDSELYEGVDENDCYDFSEDSRKFLKAVSIMKNYSLSLIILFLRGSCSARLPKIYHKHEFHGSGKAQSEEWWKNIVRILLNRKYLKETSHNTNLYTFCTLSLTDKGESFLRNENDKLLLPPPSNIIQLLKKKPVKTSDWFNSRNISQSSTSTNKITETESADEIAARMELYHRLLAVRTQIATELDCMPYMIASNACIMTISRVKPSNLDELRNLNLDGYTEAKLAKFGDRFLKVLSEKSNESQPSSIKNILALHPLPNCNAFSMTKEVTCTLFQGGMSVEEIANKRKVLPGTILGYLVEGIKAGFCFKLSKFGITNQIRDIVIDACYKSDINKDFTKVKLKDIKEKCPDHITYDQICPVVAYMQVRCHLEYINVPYLEFEDFDFGTVKRNTVVTPTDSKSDNVEPNHNLDFLITEMEKESWDSDSDTTIIFNDWENEPPPTKKGKVEEDIIFDSPPRQFSFKKKEDKEPVGSNAEPTTSDPNKDGNNAVMDKKETLKKKSKKILPPWLVRKNLM